jgi:hypothetical protein
MRPKVIRPPTARHKVVTGQDSIKFKGCSRTFDCPHFKGSLTRDFQLLFFSLASFPRASEYPIGAISNCYENLQTYSKFIPDVNDTDNQWEKFLRQEVFFYIFVEMLFGCCLKSYIDFFYLMFAFRCRQADCVADALSPVSNTPSIYYRQAGVVDVSPAFLEHSSAEKIAVWSHASRDPYKEVGFIFAWSCS